MTLLTKSRARFVLVTLLIIPLYVSFGHAQGRSAPPVTVASPLQKKITRWDEFSGRFAAIENVEVKPRVSGFIEKVHFRDGQMITVGDLLFSIDKRPFQIAVESAQAEILRYKAQVLLQEDDVARARPLMKSGAVTERDLDQRKANLTIAGAQLGIAQAALKLAQLNLEWTDVRAPIAGRISDRRIDVGALVTGGQVGATTLTTIVSLDPIHFVFDASEADFLRYVRASKSGDRQSSREVNNPVRIKLADEKDWKWKGRMDFVDNQLNPRSGTIRGRAIVENKDQFLAPGLFARLQLFGGIIEALLVPDAAIVSDQTQKIIFAIGPENKIVAKPVIVGKIAHGLRVIRSGLTASDRIVINGIANPAVRPGATVAPQAGEIKIAANK
jgi:multidrug efflux system membrane fusion protein